MTTRLFTLALGLCLTATLPAQEAKKAPKAKAPNPALAPVTDTPGLPRVLLIGDSISIGYTLPVREALQGKANVHRPPTNCGPTTRGVEQLDQWLGSQKWDVIHFNFGLHDLKYVDTKGKSISPDKGNVQVPLDAYKTNLDAMVVRMKKTGAKLVFATTTPVPAGEPQRIADSDTAYNAAAREVMAKHGVAVNDLNAYVRGRRGEGQLPKNVHFTASGSKALADEVVTAIRAALKQ